MTSTIGTWLQLAARSHRARMAEAIEDIGLFPGQEQVMLILSKGDPMTVGQVADQLRVRPPTVSKTLIRLTAQGLIARGEHAVDARKASVTLTPEGLNRARSLESRIRKVEDEFLADFDDKEIRRLRKLLKRLVKSNSRSASADISDDDGDAAD